MASNDYHFVTVWRIAATPDEITEVLGDAPALARWWPSVYDWTVIAEKGVLKNLSIVMKPIFSSNHHWAMARGEESLKIELARRHAATDPTIRAAIPKPPGPTFPHNLRLFRRG